MKIHTTKLTGFHGVSRTIVGHSTSAFFCSLSEAQKGAEDKGQIKAQLGGMPATPLNENKLMGFHGVFMDDSWSHDLWLLLLLV